MAYLPVQFLLLHIGVFKLKIIFNNLKAYSGKHKHGYNVTRRTKIQTM